MPALKESVIQIIQKMPEDASVEDIMAELFFRQQVDTGLQQLDEGLGIPHEELKTRISEWQKNKMVSQSG